MLLQKGTRFRVQLYGGLAQLARALDLHSRGHRFDSDILHDFTRFFNLVIETFIDILRYKRVSIAFLRL